MHLAGSSKGSRTVLCLRSRFGKGILIGEHIGRGFRRPYLDVRNNEEVQTGGAANEASHRSAAIEVSHSTRDQGGPFARSSYVVKEPSDVQADEAIHAGAEGDHRQDSRGRIFMAKGARPSSPAHDTTAGRFRMGRHGTRSFSRGFLSAGRDARHQT